MRKITFFLFLFPLLSAFSLPEGIKIVDGVAQIPGEKLFGSREFREMQYDAKRYPDREVIYETHKGKVLIAGDHIEVVPYGTYSHAEILNGFAMDTTKGLYWEELEMRDIPESPFRNQIRVYLAEVYDHEYESGAFRVARRDSEGNEALASDPFAAPGDATIRESSVMVAKPIDERWHVASFPAGSKVIENIGLGPAGHGSLVINPVKGFCMCHETFSVRLLDSTGKVIQHFPELLNGDVAVRVDGPPSEDVKEIVLHSSEHGNVTVYSILLKYQPDETGSPVNPPEIPKNHTDG